MTNITPSNPLINKFQMSGRVGTEPVRSTEKSPFKFRLAHGGGGGKRKDGSPWATQWFTVAIWDTKLMDGVVRGALVELAGRLRDSTYTAKDGTTRYGVELVADSIVVAGKEAQPALIPDMPKGGGTQIARAILSPATTKNVESDDADIPLF